MTIIANKEKTKRKPANGFKKGQSGNPKGRPKLTAEELDLVAACKEKTPAALVVIESLMRGSNSDRTRLAAAMAIVERAYGKPEQPVKAELSGKVSFGWME